MIFEKAVLFPWESFMKYLLFYHHTVNLLNSCNHFRLEFVCSLVIIPMERAERSTWHHFVTSPLHAFSHPDSIIVHVHTTSLLRLLRCLFLTEFVTSCLFIWNSSNKNKMICLKDSLLCLPWFPLLAWLYLSFNAKFTYWPTPTAPWSVLPQEGGIWKCLQICF